jgi:hypothetical protein
MSTIRVSKRETPYIMIDKFAIDKDSRISWQAKGLLTYLIGKPDDWTVRVGDLIKRASNGRDAVYSIINELIEAGYIEREQVRGNDGSGKFADISYIVYETPLHTNPLTKQDKRKKKSTSRNPLPENPDTVKSVDNSRLPENPDTVKPGTDLPDTVLPNTENPEHSNNDSTKNDFTKDDEDASSKDLNTLLIAQDIERISNRYPKYKKVIESMGADAIRYRRPIYPEEEFILEKANSSHIHPEILWNIYDSIKAEINRSTASGNIFELAEDVFNRFELNLRMKKINIDPAAWFKTTWFNTKIEKEQAEMLN